MLTGSEIRRKFLDFFVQKGHKEVHSSSLVPANDPTLLFTNAGMNQFKDVFLGLEKRDYSRATTSQKCVRAGGKHNDLENVGFTNRHHTFFEMLGNFSFGDYFKKDAIAYAWELITSKEWFGIDRNKLYVTIFKGEAGVERDIEAYDLWVGQGVPKDRIFEMGLKDNFWQMGDTGPCGPCSEIHYDMGPAASEQGHAECHFPCDCGRYVEIWNLVFMQFDRDASGKLNPLPKPSIDTGMGLERVTAVLQGVISNYETDLFTPLIKRAAELTGTSLAKELEKEAKAKSAASLRVIADHSRAATFLISDGVLPSNEGRGYVLRKIIRRAITHGRLLGQTKPFLHEMVFAVRDLMQDAYPELRDTADRVSKTVQVEETRFAHTLDVRTRKAGRASQEHPKANSRARKLLNFTTPSACRSISCRMRHATKASCSTKQVSIAQWRSRRLALAPRGRAARSRPPILPISSFRNRSSKAIGRLALTAAKCWPLFTTGRGRGNSRLANLARSSLITRRSMPNPAGRLVTGDGFIRTITIPSLPTLRDAIRRFRGCGRIRLSLNRPCAWATKWMLS